MPRSARSREVGSPPRAFLPPPTRPYVVADAAVLLVILLTMIAMLVANKLEFSEETVQVYILYGQLGVTALYILLRVSRIFMIFLATVDTHGDVSAKFVMLAIRGRRNLKVSAGGYVRGATHNGADEDPKLKTVTNYVANPAANSEVRFEV